MRAIYSLLFYLLIPFILIRLLWRSIKAPAYRERWNERFAIYHTAYPTIDIWFHAVSVGETHAAKPLILELLNTYPEHDILLTGMTPTGRAAGRECFGVEKFGAAAGRVHQAYLPYDYPGAVTRFLMHFQPELGLLMETELWPNLMAACQTRHVPVVLVNARLSARSAKGYQRFSGLTRPAFQQLQRVAAQSDADAQRFRELGALHVEVCGNLKFDVTPDPVKTQLGQAWKSQIAERPVWLAASTREGEEQELVAAHQTILKERPDALCILVPRHPQRFVEVALLAEQAGLSVIRRSQGLPQPDTQVWLGDSMGEMAAYYAATSISVIGGSWQPLGGQNLIEAAACGSPIVVGPHTFNFAQATEDALAAGAVLRLADCAEIPLCLLGFWRDAQQQHRMRHAAHHFAIQHQGATQRILATIVGIIRPLD